jgi:DinB superfamily
MKKIMIMMAFFVGISTTWGQEGTAHSEKSWTDADRKALADQYKRTKAEVNAETGELTASQWNFKEGPGKWSIAEVLEHLNMWSLLTQQDARYATYLGPNPELAKLCKSDSINTSFIYEASPHVSPDHTIPTGLIKEENNLKIFNLKYDELIRVLDGSKLNFRLHVREGKDNNHRDLAQIYIIHYGHVDRHLRQIRRIKKNASFPTR